MRMQMVGASTQIGGRTVVQLGTSLVVGGILWVTIES